MEFHKLTVRIDRKTGRAIGVSLDGNEVASVRDVQVKAPHDGATQATITMFCKPEFVLVELEKSAADILL